MGQVIRKRVRHRSLHGLLERVVRSETAQRDFDERSKFRESGLVKGRGIRQGMPLSPVFAYLFLAEDDQAAGTNFFRYVDDLLFFGPQERDVRARFTAYRDAVESKDLRIHPLGSEKTSLVLPDSNFDFLGVRVDRTKSPIEFEIPSKVKFRIKNDIDPASRLDRADTGKQKGWVLSVSNKASNLVRNYSSAYHFCRDWNTFEKTLKELQVSMCRQIAREISAVEKSKDTTLLRRIFGI